MSLPQPWLNQDIDTPGTPGTTSYASGVFSMTGFGGGVNGTNDQMQFAYVPIYGDCTVTARITVNSGAFTTAGLMIRSDLTPSAQVYDLDAGGPSLGQISVGGHQRTTVGGNSSSFIIGLQVPTTTWFRISRSGNNFTAFWSSDGITWTSINAAAATIVFGSPNVYVGLMGYQGGPVVTFDNVTVSGSANFSIQSGHAGAIASIETSPGVYQLMIGDSRASKPVCVRDSSYSTFADNGTAYEAGLVLGNIVLAQPGELAEVGFIACDLVKSGTQPVVSVLMDEISGTFTSISSLIVADPPILYGPTAQPNTLYSNRYYMKQVGMPPAWCRHLQLKVDFGNTDAVMNELLTSTLWGAILAEGG